MAHRRNHRASATTAVTANTIPSATARARVQPIVEDVAAAVAEQHYVGVPRNGGDCRRRERTRQP
jgi:hypothetical protein